MFHPLSDKEFLFKNQSEFILNVARTILKSRGEVSNGALVKIVEIYVGAMPSEARFDARQIVNRVWPQIQKLPGFVDGDSHRNRRENADLPRS